MSNFGNKNIYCSNCGEHVGTLDCRYDCECGCQSFVIGRQNAPYNGPVQKRSMEKYLAERRNHWKLPRKL